MNMMEQFILIKKYYKMKKLILLSLFLKVVLTYGQSSTHTIAGIDLNNNWYDLTDLDTITYDMQERDKDENSIGVITTISERYLKENAEKEFLEINFSVLRLVFPFGNSAIVKKLSPVMFMARKNYSSEYELSQSNDLYKLAYLLMNQFGTPSSTEKGDWGSSFQWEFSNANLNLYLSKKEHLNLIYIIN